MSCDSPDTPSCDAPSGRGRGFQGVATGYGVRPDYQHCVPDCPTTVPAGCVHSWLFQNAADIPIGGNEVLQFPPFQGLIVVGVTTVTVTTPGIATIKDIAFRETSVLPKLDTTKAAGQVVPYFADLSELTYEAVRSGTAPWYRAVPTANNISPAQIPIGNISGAILLSGLVKVRVWAWNPSMREREQLAACKGMEAQEKLAAAALAKAMQSQPPA